MKNTICIGINFLFSILLFAGYGKVPAAKNATLKTAGGPLIMAHRGGACEYDDNAAGGFALTLKQGIRGYEADVQFSKDHELVLMHDDTIERTATGKGAVKAMTLAELKRCRLKKSSEPIPTLAEMLAAFKGRDDFFFELEMKVEADSFYTPAVMEEYCHKLNATIKASIAPGTYVYTSFSTDAIATMHRLYPEAPVGLITGRPLDDGQLATAKRLGCITIVAATESSKAMIDKAHAMGLTVDIGRVDEATYAEAKAKGVDRIICDYPYALYCAVKKIDLFNGRDFAGWTAVVDHDVTGGYCVAEPTWFVTNGVIRTTGTPFGYLRTKRSDFGDFKLHVEYRWWRETAKPNSGVFVRLSQEHGTFIPTTIENQLCRGSAGDVLGLAGFRLSGIEPREAFTAAKPLSGITKAPRKGADVEKPFGEWNVLEVELKGDVLVSRLNGFEVNRVNDISVFNGAIALQSEGGAAEFRNVWVLCGE